MYFNIVASGSKGNATLVISKNSVILIDLGITLLRLKEGLKEINKELKDIDAVIFTHNHSDHLNGLKCISPKKMYALKGTLPSSLSNVVDLFKPFIIKDFKITPFPTSHDATNPCGYIIEADDEKLVYMTDTGVLVDGVMDYIKNPDFLIIESNHDIAMEYKTGRPLILIQRIIGDHGHLCNEDSAFIASDAIGDKTKEIILAHLSEEANTPEVALESYRNVFKYKGIDFDRYNIRCAKQYESLLGGNLNEN